MMDSSDLRYQSGLDGEAAAEKYLTDRGMVCLAKRFKGGDGEIDLIMQDGDIIAFVEVKARPGSAPGSGLASITPAKQRRIGHAAGHYLMKNNLFGRQLRFDALEITRNGILYIPNAFQPPVSWR